MDISNRDETIDIRDVKVQIDDIQSEIETLNELKASLQTLVDAVGDEITLIRESYFREYAEQLAEDIGSINSENSWPLSHIDWDAAADELKMDYSTVEFDGVTYYYRA